MGEGEKKEGKEQKTRVEGGEGEGGEGEVAYRVLFSEEVVLVWG